MSKTSDYEEFMDSTMVARAETNCKNKPAYPGNSTWEELEASLAFSTISPPPESYDNGTISPPTDPSDNNTVSPYAESALDVAVKIGLRMSKEGIWMSPHICTAMRAQFSFEGKTS